MKNVQCLVLAFVSAIALQEAVAHEIITLPEMGERLKTIESIIGVSSNDSSHMHRNGCPTNFRHHQNSCYHFGVMPLTWFMAKIACQQMDAKLVAVETYVEEEFILQTVKALLNTHHLVGFWTAGNNFNGTWLWNSTGNRIGDYQPWGHNQPDSPKGLCLKYYREDMWRWHDCDCSHNVPETHGVGFVCEKPFDY